MGSRNRGELQWPTLWCSRRPLRRDRCGAPTVLQPGEGASTTGGIVRPAQPFARDAVPILLLWAGLRVLVQLSLSGNVWIGIGQWKKQSNLACLSVEQCFNSSRTRLSAVLFTHRDGITRRPITSLCRNYICTIDHGHKPREQQRSRCLRRLEKMLTEVG